jgi:hypothetical protein
MVKRVNKVELLENFDKANNGTYKLDDLAELIIEAYELGCDTEWEKIKRVIELHYAVNDGGCGDPDCCSPSDSEDFCIICGGYEYPCETIKALDGDK